MKKSTPLALRLPFSLIIYGFSLEKLLSRQHYPWSVGWQYLPFFQLSPAEKSFACQLLEKKRNSWLFRCNQQGFCGDFLLVDMSSPIPKKRPIYLLELKAGMELKLGGGGAGVQFQRAKNVFSQIRQTGIIAIENPSSLVCGSPEELLTYLRVPPI